MARMAVIVEVKSCQWVNATCAVGLVNFLMMTLKSIMTQIADRSVDFVLLAEVQQVDYGLQWASVEENRRDHRTLC